MTTETTPAYTRAVAEVLAEHQSRPTGSPFCRCGWRPSMFLNDTESDRLQHVAHQADALAAAGLLADPDALDAAEEENARLRALQQAITECRDDPAGAIVRADRIAGEHILRAIAAEMERDAALAEVAALRGQYRELATYRTTHANLGLCPEGPGDPARDPACPVCRALAADEDERTSDRNTARDPCSATCPSCGVTNPFEVKPPCSLDQYDPDDWHRSHPAAAAPDPVVVAAQHIAETTGATFEEAAAGLATITKAFDAAAPAADDEPWECQHQPRCADAACSHNPAMRRWVSGRAADDEGGQE